MRYVDLECIAYGTSCSCHAPRRLKSIENLSQTIRHIVRIVYDSGSEAARPGYNCDSRQCSGKLYRLPLVQDQCIAPDFQYIKTLSFSFSLSPSLSLINRCLVHNV